MFTIPMPTGFKVGDTLPVTVNGKVAMLHYRDATHLVIDDTDVRVIESISPTNMGGGQPLQMFILSDAAPREPVFLNDPRPIVPRSKPEFLHMIGDDRLAGGFG